MFRFRLHKVTLLLAEDFSTYFAVTSSFVDDRDGDSDGSSEPIMCKGCVLL